MNNDILDYINLIADVKKIKPLEKFNNLDTANKIILGVAVTSLLVRASQSLIVSHRLFKENERQDRTYYDPSSHMRWDLRRKPTNYEKSEILRRRNTGEDIYDILRSLGLSK